MSAPQWRIAAAPVLIFMKIKKNSPHAWTADEGYIVKISTTVYHERGAV